MKCYIVCFGIICMSWLALVSIAGAVEKNIGATEQTALNVAVDFAKSLGKIRALNGVVNGPFVISYHMDNTASLYKEAGFPSVRLESCNWPSASVLDVHSIFPLFHADADDPRNYIFDPADQYLEPIVKNGSQIIFRLGNGIEYPTHFYTGGKKGISPIINAVTYKSFPIETDEHLLEKLGLESTFQPRRRPRKHI